MKPRINAYRACTTYEAFNVFWPSLNLKGEEEPIGMLWSRHDVLDYSRIHNIEIKWIVR